MGLYVVPARKVALVCGDSLTGIGTLGEAEEILDPDIDEGKAHATVVHDQILDLIRRAEDALRRLGRVSDADHREVKAARVAAGEAARAVEPVRDLFDLLVAVRLGWVERPEAVAEAEIAANPHLGKARALAAELNVLHFPVAFPEVFLRDCPGFDCILGNPPWEKLHVEEHGFWALRFPGLRGMKVAEQNAEIVRLREERVDLVAEYEAEVSAADAMRTLLLKGPYPGLGSSHPDLFKAFAWRFWHLCREDGTIGVVLPRSALAAAGSAEWREAILDGGAFADVTLLVNNRHWVFEDVHAQWTIGLVSIRKGPQHEGTVCLRGPFASMEAYLAERTDGHVAEFPATEFRTWMTGAAFPLLPSARSGAVFLKLRAHPRFDDGSHPWRARPIQGDLNATAEKDHMILDPQSTEGLWPIYKGASFDIWEPDTGEYYAWADPDYITDYLQRKRERAARHSKSAFSGMPANWIADPSTLPCRHPRIAFRDVTRATDSRTVRAALIPADVLVNHVAPYVLWRVGSPRHCAYLLGILCSIPLDWYARRTVETHLDFHQFNPLPIPIYREDSLLVERVVAGVVRLAAVDDRYSTWVERVDSKVNSAVLNDHDHEVTIAELDAAVAHLYGLDADDLKHIFETFHEGWDYTERLERVLDHFEDLRSLA